MGRDAAAAAAAAATPVAGETVAVVPFAPSFPQLLAPVTAMYGEESTHCMHVECVRCEYKKPAPAQRKQEMQEQHRGAEYSLHPVAAHGISCFLPLLCPPLSPVHATLR